MNILVVGNGGTVSHDNAFFKDKHTVKFLQDLVKNFDTVSWFEPVVTAKNLEAENLLSSKLDITIHVANKKIMKRGLFWKITEYSRLTSVGIFHVRKTDFVYLFFYGHLSLIMALIAMFFGKPYALFIRTDFTPTSFLEKIVVKSARFILTTGDGIASRVRSINSKVGLVAPMIDFSTGDLFTRGAVERLQPKKILFVGRLQRDKGIYVLLDAIFDLQKKGIDLKLDVVGGGPEYDAMRCYADKLGILHVVHFYGLIKDKKQLRQLYRDADIFVLPSFHEGFPRVLYEAMLSSLPIITTAVGSIPSVLADEKSALFVTVDNSTILAEAICRLVDDANLRQKLSNGAAAAILSYLSQFDVPHAEQFKDLIERVAENV